MATLASPRAPAPKTRTLPPGGGGWRTMAWKDTEKGSASTAASSEMSSGTGKSMDEWVANSSAQAPGAPVTTPMWTPGLMSPLVNDQHMLRSPAWHGGHRGVIPRGAQLSQGLSTTRWPTSTPRASGPRATTSATTSWPGTWGSEEKAAIGLSMSPSWKSPEHQLGVGAAHPGEDRAGDHPVGMDGMGVVHLVEAEGQGGQPLLELVGRDRPRLVGIGAGPEHEGLHDALCRDVRSGRRRPWPACRPRTRRSPSSSSPPPPSCRERSARTGRWRCTRRCRPPLPRPGPTGPSRGRVVVGLVPDLGVEGAGQHQPDRHAGARTGRRPATRSIRPGRTWRRCRPPRRRCPAGPPCSTR